MLDNPKNNHYLVSRDKEHSRVPSGYGVPFGSHLDQEFLSILFYHPTSEKKEGEDGIPHKAIYCCVWGSSLIGNPQYGESSWAPLGHGAYLLGHAYAQGEKWWAKDASPPLLFGYQEARMNLYFFWCCIFLITIALRASWWLFCTNQDGELLFADAV